MDGFLWFSVIQQAVAAGSGFAGTLQVRSNRGLSDTVTLVQAGVSGSDVRVGLHQPVSRPWFPLAYPGGFK